VSSAIGFLRVSSSRAVIRAYDLRVETPSRVGRGM